MRYNRPTIQLRAKKPKYGSDFTSGTMTDEKQFERRHMPVERLG
jgi:hypothetical protein